MNYAQLRRYDTTNWDGINTTLFVSGCRFNCVGCFNKEAQSFGYGLEFTDEVEDTLIQYANSDHVDGVCILGGEIFHQNLDDIFRIVIRLKTEVNKPIHIWSGFTWEELIKDSNKVMILKYCDTLVDGPFILEKKDLNLKFRGSSNQRVIDIKKSLLTGEVVTYDK